jgi:predicted Ser/Thr protein kinase
MTAGRRIGAYEVVRELGRGGMGVVYEARDPTTGRRLALKLIIGDEAEGDALARFRREAEVMARVSHPNVVRVHALDRAPEGPFIVTELVDGQGLDGLTRKGPLPPEVAARLVRALADAIAALHAQGVVHRDLKPQNVIVRPDGAPVLLDFGIARDLISKERLTVTGSFLGTPAYMAPEQAEAGSPSALGPAVDVYALGALLLETLSGRPPFDDSGGPFATIKKVLVDPPRWPSTVVPSTPHALEAICKVAMSKAAPERYASAATLRDDLDRYLRGEPPLALARLPAPRSAVLPMIGVGAAALACAVGAVALVLALAREQAGPPVAPVGPAVAVPSAVAPTAVVRSLARVVTDGATGKALLSLPGAGHTRGRLVVGGRALTFSEEDRTVVLWMLEDPPRELARTTLQDPPLAVAVADGQAFVRTWSKAHRLELATLSLRASHDLSTPRPGGSTYNQGLALSDGAVIAPGTRVERLDPDSLEPRGSLEPGDERLPELHAAAAQGGLVCAGGGVTSRGTASIGRGELFVWQGEALVSHLGQLPSCVTCVAMRPADEPLVACGMFSGYLALGPPDAPRPLGDRGEGIIRAHPEELQLEAVAFSPDGALLLSVAFDRQPRPVLTPGELCAWSVVDRTRRWRLEGCELPLSVDCAMIEGRLVLLVGTARGCVELWLAPER